MSLDDSWIKCHSDTVTVIQGYSYSYSIYHYIVIMTCEIQLLLYVAGESRAGRLNRDLETPSPLPAWIQGCGTLKGPQDKTSRSKMTGHGSHVLADLTTLMALILKKDKKARTRQKCQDQAVGTKISRQG